MSAPLERKNLQVLLVGPTGSGKGQAAHQLFVSKFDRVLSVDFNRELAEQKPSVICAYGLADTLEALHRLADARRWHVAAVLTRAEIPRLCRVLCPPITSDDTTSYPREVGGLLLECGEASKFAPSGRTPDEVETLFTAGRHYNLSSVMGCQRISQIALELVNGAHVVQVFNSQEGADLTRYRQMWSRDVAERVAELAPHHSLYFVRATRCLYHLAPDYSVIEVIDRRGAVIDAPAAA